MLTTELAAGSRLRVVPRDRVARMTVELDLPAGDEIEPLARAGSAATSTPTTWCWGRFPPSAPAPAASCASISRSRRPGATSRWSTWRRPVPKGSSSGWSPAPAPSCARSSGWTISSPPNGGPCGRPCRAPSTPPDSTPKGWRRSAAPTPRPPAISSPRRWRPIPTFPSPTPPWPRPGASWATTSRPARRRNRPSAPAPGCRGRRAWRWRGATAR